MARALVRSVRAFVKPTKLRGRHGKESEEGKEDRQGDQESRQEDQEDEEVSARFSASAKPPRHRGDDQTGPMCTRLKKPATNAHGAGFLFSLCASCRPSPVLSTADYFQASAPFADAFSGARVRAAGMVIVGLPYSFRPATRRAAFASRLRAVAFERR